MEEEPKLVAEWHGYEFPLSQMIEINKVATVLSDHFAIPCDLCSKYFNKDGSCPHQIEKCNGFDHWNMLIERIGNSEED